MVTVFPHVVSARAVFFLFPHGGGRFEEVRGGGDFSTVSRHRGIRHIRHTPQISCGVCGGKPPHIRQTKKSVWRVFLLVFSYAYTKIRHTERKITNRWGSHIFLLEICKDAGKYNLRHAKIAPEPPGSISCGGWSFGTTCASPRTPCGTTPNGRRARQHVEEVSR
jgi:hypothetical protein